MVDELLHSESELSFLLLDPISLSPEKLRVSIFSSDSPDVLLGRLELGSVSEAKEG